MRRVFIVMLSVILSVCVFTVMAEPFTFSNGVRWGMTAEEVKAIEPEEPDEEFSMGAHLWDLSYENQKVSKYTASREYVFADDSLVCTVYWKFSSGSEADRKYLEGALGSLYGEGSELAPETVNDFMGSLTGMDETRDVSDGVAWNVDGETLIWLFVYEKSEIYIMYVDAAFDPDTIGEYDTYGL